MYIIDNNRIIEKQLDTLPMKTGLDITQTGWIDNKLINTGIFYNGDIVYYKYHEIAQFIIDNRELSQLYNSYNIIRFVNNKISFYEKLKNFLESTNGSFIGEKFENIGKMIHENINYLDFFINYSKKLLLNEHIEYCNKIDKKLLIDITSEIDNTNPLLYFLNDIKMLLIFDKYSDHILKTSNEICDILYNVYK